MSLLNKLKKELSNAVVPCLWIESINIIKMRVLPNLQTQCNLTQNPAAYFMELDNLNSNIYVEKEKT